LLIASKILGFEEEDQDTTVTLANMSCVTYTASIDSNGPPTKPELNIVKVNLEGSFYTWKLAVHYFRKQPDTDERDRCFIITGSMTAYIDSPVSSSSLA
jgi:hypothetical protein